MLNYKKKNIGGDAIVADTKPKNEINISDITKIENMPSEHNNNPNNNVVNNVAVLDRLDTVKNKETISEIHNNIPYLSEGGINKATIPVVDKQHEELSIIVETDRLNKKFLFYDKRKNYMGGFSVHEFIRYITSHVNIKFLSGYSAHSSQIIEKYICNVSLIEQPIKKYVINMHNYFVSPFMGNIETLINLYTFIHEFEIKEFRLELEKLNPDEMNDVQAIFNEMIYALLYHMLKIIAALSDKITGTTSNNIKDKLINYSVSIVYRLLRHIKETTDNKLSDISSLERERANIGLTRTNMTSRIEILQRSIDKQNTEIDLMMRNIMMHKSDANSNHEHVNLYDDKIRSKKRHSKHKKNRTYPEIYTERDTDQTLSDKSFIYNQETGIKGNYPQVNKDLPSEITQTLSDLLSIQHNDINFSDISSMAKMI
jgi:hypothetical protein